MSQRLTNFPNLARAAADYTCGKTTIRAYNEALKTLSAQVGKPTEWYLCTSSDLERAFGQVFEKLDKKPAAAASKPTTPAAPIKPPVATYKPIEPTQPRTFEEACRWLHEGGLTQFEAIKMVVEDYPELHRSYRERGGQIFTPETTYNGVRFETLVNTQVAAGKSKGEAIRYCIRNHPAAYAEWRKGDTSKL